MDIPQQPLQNEETQPRNARWQFGLWWLFLLMTGAAAIAGLVRYAAVDPWFRAGLAGYLMLLCGYATLRLPWVLSGLLGFSADRRRIRDQRKRLAEWTEWKRTQAIDNQSPSEVSARD